MRKSHECHSEPEAKNLAFTGTYESEILRLSPQDDIATQSPDAGEEQRWGLERSVAVELSEAIERIERFFMRNSDAEKHRPLD